MKQSLLLLNALRAFDATARHLNIGRAAEELSVSQGAVSHHIKKLERMLRVKLLERENGVLSLTVSGRELSVGVQDGFRALELAVDRAVNASDQNVLTVNAMPCFAEMWLVPRIASFAKACPDIQLRVRAVTQSKHSLTDGADVTIRYRPGPFPGFKVERLATEEIFPVCSPALANPPKIPSDLQHHTLIHDEWLRPMESFPEWKDWLSAAGVPDVDSSKGLRLNITASVIEATLAGQGIALGRSVLVRDLVRENKLKRLFDVTYPVTFSYYLISPKNRSVYEKVRRFREWIFAEIGEALP
jgi:LysR family glycine cleavage system transcriptional activator